MTFIQVAAEFPGLAASLQELSAGDLDQAVRRIVETALATTGVEVPDRSRGALEQLVWSLDDAAWDLQEKAERGASSSTLYNQAFRRARAASGLLELQEGHYGRAVFEATHALGGHEGTVLRILDGSA